jgi:hypothetical protein
MSEVMLTTIDNPYDPFTHFDEWYEYDLAKGYDTCGLLARFAITAPELGAKDESLAIDEAMDKVLSLNLYGVHKKVYKQ